MAHVGEWVSEGDREATDLTARQLWRAIRIGKLENANGCTLAVLCHSVMLWLHRKFHSNRFQHSKKCFERRISFGR